MCSVQGRTGLTHSTQLTVASKKKGVGKNCHKRHEILKSIIIISGLLIHEYPIHESIFYCGIS